MSHVQKLRERLEGKIKDQQAAISTTPSKPAAAAATATATAATASTASSSASKKQSIAPTPVLFYTPEEFAKKQKEDEMNEKQNKLNAKQIASKYNMTYRAFELGARKENTSSSSKPYSKHTGASGTRRASVTAKGKAGAGAGGDDEFQEFHVEDDTFWMSELALALQYEDDMAINRAILFEFFEENDPEKLMEVDQMLLEWAGREDELFAFLALAYMDQSTGTDDTAEQTAFMMFQTTANGTAATGKAVPPIIKDGTSVALGGMLSSDKPPATGAATTATAADAKPRRTSVINKIALGSSGIQAAAVSTVAEPKVVRDEDEEKTDVSTGPYILSGVAQQGHVWKVNAHDKEDNDMIRARMLAAGHTEEEINAVISKQT